MKKLFTFFTFSILTFSISAQTEKGTFYMALGNAYSPMGEVQIGGGVTQEFFSNSSGMSFGNEWVTGITIDGDDDNDNGTDYWDSDSKESLGNFNISGQFGFFAADGLLTGVGIEFATLTYKTEFEDNNDLDEIDDEYTGKANYSSLAFSPFVKYYIPINQNALFFSTSYTFGSINRKSEWEWDNTSDADQDDNDEDEPYKTSRLEFGAGLSLFLTNSIALEPSLNFALNKYKQEEEVYIGNTGSPNFDSIYDDQEKVVSTNAFYIKVAASMYF